MSLEQLIKRKEAIVCPDYEGQSMKDDVEGSVYFWYREFRRSTEHLPELTNEKYLEFLSACEEDGEVWTIDQVCDYYYEWYFDNHYIVEEEDEDEEDEDKEDDEDRFTNLKSMVEDNCPSLIDMVSEDKNKLQEFQEAVFEYEDMNEFTKKTLLDLAMKVYHSLPLPPPLALDYHSETSAERLWRRMIEDEDIDIFIV